MRRYSFCRYFRFIAATVILARFCAGQLDAVIVNCKGKFHNVAKTRTFQISEDSLLDVSDDSLGMMRGELISAELWLEIRAVPLFRTSI